MVCEWAEKIQALHDGALDAAQRETVEGHALVCAECARELAALRAVSRFIKAGAPRVVQAGELAPLYARIRAGRVARLNEPRVIRLTKWLTTAAAAVMVACSVSLTKQPEQTTSVVTNTQNWTALALGAEYVEQSDMPDPFSPMPEVIGEDVHE